MIYFTNFWFLAYLLLLRNAFIYLPPCLCADSRPDLVLFSFGIAEQCTRHEKIMRFLKSRSNEAEGGVLDLSLLSDLMGLQPLTFDSRQQPSSPSLIYPTNELLEQKPLMDFVGDMARSSKITIHPDGRILFTGSGTEMNDFLSIVAEFYLSRNSTKWTKQSLLIPHFDRYGYIVLVDSSIMYEYMWINYVYPHFRIFNIVKNVPVPVYNWLSKVVT